METIEIFLQEEVKELVTDEKQLKEWHEKVEELGLSGQKEIVGEEGKSPVPFPAMNNAMVNTYSVLCPNNYKLDEYNKSAIPLRVLSVLALCKQERYFSKIQIWTAENIPDLIAVGFLGDNWNAQRYIIARWGDELCDFPTLQKRAVEIMKKTSLHQMRKHKAEVEQKIANFNELAELHVNGVNQYFPS